MGKEVFPEPVTADQGAAGASPWPVSISSGTIEVSNLVQLTVATDLNVADYNLNSAAYSADVAYSQDSLLGVLELRFSTTSSRDITVSLDDGTVVASITGDTSSTVSIDFEDYEIDSGTTLTLDITQTAGACLADITLTSKVGSSTIGGDPTVNQGPGATSGVPWRVINTVHSEVHAGMLYSGAAYNAAVANGADLKLLMQTGSTDLHVVVTVASSGDATMVMYEGTTFSSAGTSVTMSNHNRQSANTPSFTVTHTPTVTGNGTQINGTILVPGGTKGSGSGGSNAFIEEWILKQNENYLVVLTNDSGGDQKHNIEVRAYERNLS